MRELWSNPGIRIWLAIAGCSTLILGTAYAMVQQSTRLAADDLPMATAQTAKQELEKDASPSDVIPTTKTDLAADSTVFVIVTDTSRHVLASSAGLNGKTPLPPAGVFDYTTSHNDDHFTWQPAADARLATRVLTYGSGANSGFVISGQSLKQAESRINEYTLMAFVAWVATLGWSFLVLLAPTREK